MAADVLDASLGAIVGLVLGSFLNVCIYRMPRDLSVVRPRSFCPECGLAIAWYDNVPILSFLILRGRCRECQKAISVRYPLVEVATAALFFAVVARYGATLAGAKWAAFEALLMILFWTDLEERILPDELTLGGAVIGLAFSLFVCVPGQLVYLLWGGIDTSASFANAVLGMVVLAIPIWAGGAIYGRIRRRQALGRGDVKLLLLLGAFLGLEKGLIAAAIGAAAGSVIGLIYILVMRKNAATYWLPLGSFLCAGAAIVPFIGG